MDFSERLDLYQEGGMITAADVKTVNDIIAMFKSQYGIELCEENADTFIAHLCAALGRSHTSEPVEPLMEEAFAEVKELDTFPISQKMLEDIRAVLAPMELSETEAQYLLLHINTLLEKAGPIQ